MLLPILLFLSSVSAELPKLPQLDEQMFQNLPTNDLESLNKNLLKLLQAVSLNEHPKTAGADKRSVTTTIKAAPTGTEKVVRQVSMPVAAVPAATTWQPAAAAAPAMPAVPAAPARPQELVTFNQKLRELENSWLDVYLHRRSANHSGPEKVAPESDFAEVQERFNEELGQQQAEMKGMYNAIAYEEMLKKSNIAFLAFLKSYLKQVEGDLIRREGLGGRDSEMALNKKAWMASLHDQLDKIEIDKNFDIQLMKEKEFGFRSLLTEIGSALREIGVGKESKTSLNDGVADKMKSLSGANPLPFRDDWDSLSGGHRLELAKRSANRRSGKRDCGSQTTTGGSDTGSDNPCTPPGESTTKGSGGGGCGLVSEEDELALQAGASRNSLDPGADKSSSLYAKTLGKHGREAGGEQPPCKGSTPPCSTTLCGATIKPTGPTQPPENTPEYGCLSRAREGDGPNKPCGPLGTDVPSGGPTTPCNPVSPTCPSTTFPCPPKESPPELVSFGNAALNEERNGGAGMAGCGCPTEAEVSTCSTTGCSSTTTCSTTCPPVSSECSTTCSTTCPPSTCPTTCSTTPACGCAGLRAKRSAPQGGRPHSETELTPVLLPLSRLMKRSAAVRQRRRPLRKRLHVPASHRSSNAF